eukprot:2318226-Amphidinium_carterae.1
MERRLLTTTNPFEIASSEDASPFHTGSFAMQGSGYDFAVEHGFLRFAGFPALTKLSVAGNELKSIEGLADVPELKEILHDVITALSRR